MKLAYYIVSIWVLGLGALYGFFFVALPRLLQGELWFLVAIFAGGWFIQLCVDYLKRQPQE